MKCSKCDKEATFDSPDNLCDEHWAEWWVAGVEPEAERIKYKAEILEE